MRLFSSRLLLVLMWSVALAFAPTLAVAGATLTPTPTATAWAWYDLNWPYRKPITLNESQIPGAAPLANFVVLITHTDPDWQNTGYGGHVGGARGGDILFTLADGVTKLDHELEAYDPATGSLIAWVEMPSLSATTNTGVYVYYGNAAAPDQGNGAGTWASGYRMVQHLQQDPGGAAPQLLDATGNHNDGTVGGGMGSSAWGAGKIGKGLALDGVDDFINIAVETGLNFTSVDAFTFSMWIKTGDTSTRSILMGDYNGEPDTNLELSKNGKLRAHVSSTGPTKDYVGTSVVTDNTWRSVALTYSGAGQVLQLYVNGCKSEIVS